jgi:hypothetical protein
MEIPTLGQSAHREDARVDLHQVFHKNQNRAPWVEERRVSFVGERVRSPLPGS